MTRPFCIKTLHTRCRHTPSQCDCICHKDTGSRVIPARITPSPFLQAMATTANKLLKI
jgi:hypothetical protein